MHVFTEWIWWFDSRSPQSIVWMAGSFQSTQDMCFPFSSAHPLCLVVFSTLPSDILAMQRKMFVVSFFLLQRLSLIANLTCNSWCKFPFLLIMNSIAVEEAVDNRGLYRNDCCNVCFHVLAMTRGQWLWSTDVQWLTLNNQRLRTMTVSRRCFKLLFWWFCAILPLEQCLGWRNAYEWLFSWISSELLPF